ncbi:MAG: hypothetical protein BWY52_00346 [Chloroflexi bacterium ADurb.Bin325]|nr:MAG: hypothetical protein BWY52_00346 [Chloroflexi bacterium ADurb.Bin325]
MTRSLNALAIVAGVGAVLLRNPLLALLALLLGLLAGITALWDRYALTNVTYQRQLSTTRLFVGEQADLVIEITNAKPLPLSWLKAEDEFPTQIDMARGRLFRTFRSDRQLLTNLLALRLYERVRKHYHLTAIKRGVLAFGPVLLRSGDLFGFRQQQRVDEQVDEMVVYPRVVPVSELALPASYPFGDLPTRRRLTDDPLRITGTRPYVPGDNPRFLHWKATARRGELQSKTFDPGASSRTAIFLDIQTVRGAPGMVEDYLEYAISTAASLARLLLDRREAVGLYANGWQRRTAQGVRLPPSRRPEQWEFILDALARLIDSPAGPLEQYLRGELPSLPYGASVIAITAVPAEPIYAALLDVRRGGHAVTLLTIGDERPADVPDGIPFVWLGGHDAYAQSPQRGIQPWAEHQRWAPRREAAAAPPADVSPFAPKPQGAGR